MHEQDDHDPVLDELSPPFYKVLSNQHQKLRKLIIPSFPWTATENHADESGFGYYDTGHAQSYTTNNRKTFNRCLAIATAQASLGAPGVLRKAAELAGYKLIKRATPDGNRPSSLLSAVSRASRNCADLMDIWAESMDDGEISRDERRQLREQVARMRTQLAAFEEQLKDAK